MNDPMTVPTELDALIGWVKDGKRDYELTWLFSKAAELGRTVQARQSTLRIEPRVTRFLAAPFDTAQYGPLLYDSNRVGRIDLAEKLKLAFDLHVMSVRDGDNMAFYRNLISEDETELAVLEKEYEQALTLEERKRDTVSIDVFKRLSRFIDSVIPGQRILLTDLAVDDEFERLASRASALKLKIAYEAFKVVTPEQTGTSDG